MAELYLVRHAQASFGTDDYDRLTELGHRQSRWLGEYFAERGMQFDRVLTGTLRRHRETLEGIAPGCRQTPTAEIDCGLDEYSARRWSARTPRQRTVGYAPGPSRTAASTSGCCAKCSTRGRRRARCRRALRFTDFVSAHARRSNPRGGPGAARVLVVSSGGPDLGIARNAGGRSAAQDDRLQPAGAQQRRQRATLQRESGHLVSFNNVPHLDRPGRSESITYS
jgi:broad specificity phosphatase PhoE